MAYTPLKISIAEPCHEDWNGMHPVSGSTARHCDSCAKNVVDFTGFTDAQLHAYVRLNGEKMCGRFRPDQLGRPLRAVSKPTSHPLKVAATAAGLMLAASGCGTVDTAQSLADEGFEPIELSEELAVNPPVTGGVSIEEIEHPKTCPPLPPSLDSPVMGKIRMPTIAAAQPEVHEEELVGDISVVWQEKNLPEENAIVAVPPPPPPPPPKLGQFEVMGGPIIELTEQEGDGARVQGEVNEAAASATETDAPTNSIPEVTVVDLPVIEVVQYPVMGRIAMHHPEPTGLDFVKDSIKSMLSPASPSPENPLLHPRPRPNELTLHLENIKVFPNPFVSELTLSVELPNAQRLRVELISPNGRRVHSAALEGVAGSNTFIIEPKRRKLTHAAYHLRVTDADGNMVTRTVVR